MWGAGEHYYSIKNILGNEIIEKYIICEIQYFKDNIEPLHNNNKIKYIVNDELKKYNLPSIDIAYISGTLQYTKNYKTLLDLIINIEPELIAINRTPVWNFKTIPIKQYIGHNSNSTNAAWIFNEKEINSIMETKYRKLSLNFAVHDEPYLVPLGTFPYKSYIIKKHDTNQVTN